MTISLPVLTGGYQVEEDEVEYEQTKTPGQKETQTRTRATTSDGGMRKGRSAVEKGNT